MRCNTLAVSCSLTAVIGLGLTPVAATQDDAPPEHPVIKPMTGATVDPGSTRQEFRPIDH